MIYYFLRHSIQSEKQQRKYCEMNLDLKACANGGNGEEAAIAAHAAIERLKPPDGIEVESFYVGKSNTEHIGVKGRMREHLTICTDPIAHIPKPKTGENTAKTLLLIHYISTRSLDITCPCTIESYKIIDIRNQVLDIVFGRIYCIRYSFDSHNAHILIESLAIWQYFLTVLGDNVQDITFDNRSKNPERTRAFYDSKNECIAYLQKNKINLFDPYRTTAYTDCQEDRKTLKGILMFIQFMYETMQKYKIDDFSNFSDQRKSVAKGRALRYYYFLLSL